MSSVLSKLEKIKAKLMYAVVVGHGFIPVSRLMLVINKITKIISHMRPLEYTHPNPKDPPQRKVYDALDAAHMEMFDLLTAHKREVVEKIGPDSYEDLNNLMSELSNAKDRAFDKEHGPGASLLKRGRKFNVASVQ
jgi:hypothetical protein